EIGGRIDSEGHVLEGLDAAEVVRAADELVADGVEAIAVCLLFAHVNPAQERACGAAIARAHPGIHVILSCEADGAAREYERMVSTCLEAWLRPWHLGTLSRLEDGL